MTTEQMVDFHKYVHSFIQSQENRAIKIAYNCFKDAYEGYTCVAGTKIKFFPDIILVAASSTWLLDSGAGAVEIDGTIYSGPDYQGDDNNNNGGNGGGSKGGGSKGGGHSGSGYQGASGSHHYGRGGIASL